jgi:hypothetical protein
MNAGHDAVAELLVEAPDEHRSQQPELGCPCRRVGADGELGLGVALRSAVCGDVGSDNVVPPGHHAVHAQLGAPTLFIDESVDGRGHRLRIPVIRVRATPRMFARPRLPAIREPTLTGRGSTGPLRTA